MAKPKKTSSSGKKATYSGEDVNEFVIKVIEYRDGQRIKVDAKETCKFPVLIVGMLF